MFQNVILNRNISTVYIRFQQLWLKKAPSAWGLQVSSWGLLLLFSEKWPLGLWERGRFLSWFRHLLVGDLLRPKKLKLKKRPCPCYIWFIILYYNLLKSIHHNVIIIRISFHQTYFRLSKSRRGGHLGLKERSKVMMLIMPKKMIAFQRKRMIFKKTSRREKFKKGATKGVISTVRLIQWKRLLRKV